jgi:hypothetical protein
MRYCLPILALATTRVDALLVGQALRPAVTRAGVARLGFLDFFQPKSPDAQAQELIGTVANPCEFSEEELVALKVASISENSPARGKERYTTIDNCPPSLLGDVYPNLPRSYYDIFRNTRDEEPPDEVWDFVRSTWPVLSEKTDDELKAALEPITAVYVDIRVL